MADLQPVPINDGVLSDKGKISGSWARWLRDLVNKVDAVSGGIVSAAAKLDPGNTINGVLFTGASPITITAQPTGIVGVDKGGTGANLSATGGSSQVVKQESAGAPFTVGALAGPDLPLVPVNKGGSGADLSATGGAGQYVKQASAGGNFTVGTVPAGDLPSGIDASKIADGSVSNAEFQYLDGVTGPIQTQINQKFWNTLYRKWWAYFYVGTDAAGVLQGTNIQNGSITAASRQDATSATFYGIRFNSAGSIGSAASASGVAGMVTTQLDPTAWFHVKSGTDITSIRFYLGLTSATFTNADAFNSHYVAFRYSTAATDGGWVGVCCDGSSGNQQVTGTVANIAADTEYLLQIRLSADGTAVHFSVSTAGGAFSAEQTLSTNLPGVTTKLLMDMRVIPLVNAARNWTLSAAYCESGVLENGPNPSAIPVHNLLSATHPDTTPGTPVTGDLIAAQANSWARLPVGSAGQGLIVSGGAPAWSSDVPLKSATNAFTGANSFANSPLNLIVGQLQFPAAQNPSADANTLDDYEEGTWTPTDASGAGLSLTIASARYTKIGRAVAVTADLTYPATADASAAIIGNLPFTCGAAAGGLSVGFGNVGQALGLYVRAATTQVELYAVTGSAITNATMSGKTVTMAGIYFT